MQQARGHAGKQHSADKYLPANGLLVLNDVLEQYAQQLPPLGKLGGFPDLKGHIAQAYCMGSCSGRPRP